MLYTVLTFFVALGILVLVHEWGHYIVAKLSGVWVEKFSIGFGPKIIGFSRNGTDYRVAPIPLGGYVKLFGQDPWEEAEGDAKRAEEIARDPRAFHSKPLSRKLATVLAGPVMNIILCLCLLPMVFFVGRMEPRVFTEKPMVIDVAKDSPAQEIGLLPGDEILSLSGHDVKTWHELTTQIAVHPDMTVSLRWQRQGQIMERDVGLIQDKNRKQIAGYLGIEPLAFVGNEPIIDQVTKGSPAEAAGLKNGDRVVNLGGTPVKYWSQMTELVQTFKAQPMDITVLRGQENLVLSARSKFNEESGLWLLGITKKMDADFFVKHSYGLIESFGLGLGEFRKLFGLTTDVLARLFTGDLSYKTLGGPIQIAKATSMAARSGLGDFLYLMAFLSLQLGILNLLPIPVLDGGHVVFMLMELLRRKPVSPRFRQVTTQLGMAMLLALMVVVTINDIDSVWGFANILDSIKAVF